MKPLQILWVKVGGLWPPTTGGRLRSLHMLTSCRDVTASGWSPRIPLGTIRPVW